MMKRFFKALAVLILTAHVFALIIYMGIIPRSLFRIPDLPEIFSGPQGEPPLEETAGAEEETAEDDQEDAEAEPSEETAVGEEEVWEEDQEPVAEENGVRIELSEELPPLEEKDLYDLVRVFADAGALYAEDGQGRDCTDQIFCELAADIAAPGHFTAVFSVRTEDDQVERGPSVDMRVELTEPFLAFRQDEITVPVGEDYDPYRNILVCMDVDGTVLTEFVESEGYLDTGLAGNYELLFYIYSRVNGTAAFRNMTIHVIDQ